MYSDMILSWLESFQKKHNYIIDVINDFYKKKIINEFKKYK